MNVSAWSSRPASTGSVGRLVGSAFEGSDVGFLEGAGVGAGGGSVRRTCRTSCLAQARRADGGPERVAFSRSMSSVRSIVRWESEGGCISDGSMAARGQVELGSRWWEGSSTSEGVLSRRLPRPTRNAVGRNPNRITFRSV